LVLAVFLGLPGVATAELATPVAESPHRLTALGEVALCGALGLGGDGHYDDKGTYVGAAAIYGYRVLPWLELGGRLDYGRPGYVISDWFFTAGHVRAGLRLGRAELGLSLSAGALSLVAPDIDDDSGRAQHDHFFFGPGAAVGPDVRIGLSKAVAFTLAGEYSIGRVNDLVAVDGSYFSDDALPLKLGVMAGVTIDPGAL
jgi:hypothetical protein